MPYRRTEFFVAFGRRSGIGLDFSLIRFELTLMQQRELRLQFSIFPFQ
jgi:hypothetical protein